MVTYRFTPPLAPARLITIQGQARGGKGSLARAILQDLSTDFRVYAIDQGLKFRIFAKMALEQGLDYENISSLRDFVTDPRNKTAALERLQAAATMSKAQLEAAYYSHHTGNVSGMFGKVSETHDVVVEILLNEIRAAAKHYDIIMIDGRAMHTYGQQLHREGTVRYVLAIDVICEPLTAARRVTGIFDPVGNLSNEQLISLITTTQDISRRNSSDARRKRDPSVYLHGAYEFDVLHPPATKQAFARACREIAQLGVVSIDNSFTRNIPQLTTPSVKMVRAVLEHSLDTPAN